MDTPRVLMIHRTDAGYLFAIKGRGTMHESHAVRDFVCGAIQQSADVVLDLSECQYLDSTFLGCLVILHRHGMSHDGSFAVFADEQARQKLLEPVRLNEIVSFTESRPRCIGDAVHLQVSELERAEFCRHLLETHRLLAELGGPAAATFQGIAEQLTKELDDPGTR